MTGSLFDRLEEEIQLREKREGITAADLLALPAGMRRLVNLLTRRGEMDLAGLAEEIGQAAGELAAILAELVDKGYVHALGEGEARRYKVAFARTRRRRVPVDIWEALDQKVE